MIVRLKYLFQNNLLEEYIEYRGYSAIKKYMNKKKNVRFM